MTAATAEAIFETLDHRTREILERRRHIPLGRRRGAVVRRALLVADCLGLAMAFGVAQLVYDGHVKGSLGDAGEVLAFLVSLPLWVAVAKVYGLYDRDEERTDHTTADDFAGVFHLVTVCTFALYAVAHQSGWVRPEFAKILMFWGLSVAIVPSFRVVARHVCRRQINYLQNTIIVGAGDVGQTIALKLLKHPEYGINFVGFIDPSPKDRHPDLQHPPVLGAIDDAAELVELLDVERVIIAFSGESDQRHIELIRQLNAAGVQVDIVPRFFDVLGVTADFHAIEGLPVCGLPPCGLSRSSRMAKRAIDLAGALVGLAILAPVFIVVAAAIAVDSRGPVFFRQVRMGESRRPFHIWKFRTMVADADRRKAEVLHLNKHLRPGGDPRMFKADSDPRVTRVGRFLRRTSIDEVPQLLNVLKGDMSLVGPRPLIPEEDQFVRTWGERRLDLKPGITGLWQVLGRDGIGFDEMVRLDYRYVTGWSIFLDLRLVLRTIPLLVGR